MNKFVCRRWAVDLSTCSLSPSQLAQAAAAVQPEERIRLMKFVFIEDFLSSLVGRLLMRKFVSDSTGIAYHEVRFGRDIRGKPYLDVERSTGNKSRLIQPLSFNVSHQGDFVVLAGLIAEDVADHAVDTLDFGVGVDVMKIEYSGGKPLTEFFRLMKSKFSDREWNFIDRSRHTEKEKLKAFMRHWCLKESYVKELGLGITIDLHKISFTVDPTSVLEVDALPVTSTTLHCNDVAMSDWHFEEHMLQPQYCCALAIKNSRPEAGRFEMLSVEDVLVDHPQAKEADIISYCRDVMKKQTKKERETAFFLPN